MLLFCGMKLSLGILHGRKEGKKTGREGTRKKAREREGKMDYKLMCTPVHLKNIFKS